MLKNNGCIVLLVVIFLVFSVAFTGVGNIAQAKGSYSDFVLWIGQTDLPDGSRYDPGATVDVAMLSFVFVEVFGLQMKGEKVRFIDLQKDDWYYDYIQIAYAHGVLGEAQKGNAIFPSRKITREEIFDCFRFVQISFNENSPLLFKDLDSVSDKHRTTAKKYLSAGYFLDDNLTSLRPKQLLTFSNLFNILNNIFPNVSANNKTQEYNGNYLLSGGGVVENKVIYGNLVLIENDSTDQYFAHALNARIKNVSVHGDIFVYGNNTQKSWIYLENTTLNGNNIKLKNTKKKISIVNSEIGYVAVSGAVAYIFSDTKILSFTF